jgi:hypothetical protein
MYIGRLIATAKDARAMFTKVAKPRATSLLSVIRSFALLEVGVIRAVLSIGALLFVVSLPVAATDDTSATLVATTRENSFELSVPVSKLILTIPRGNLVRQTASNTGATSSPRYFEYYDREHGLIVSGWFESATTWPGFEKYWAGELPALKKAGIVFKEPPAMLDAVPWQAIGYDVALPKGTSASVRAELVRAGTWIDVHISVSSDDPPSESRQRALDFLKSLSVTERP